MFGLALLDHDSSLYEFRELKIEGGLFSSWYSMEDGLGSQSVNLLSIQRVPLKHLLPIF